MHPGRPLQFALSTALLLVAAGEGGCTRSGFGPTHRGIDSTVDAAVPGRDSAAAALPFALQCGRVSLIGANSADHAEPGFRADGLSLVAEDWTSTRPTLDAPFGDWVADSGPLPVSVQDVTFFTYQDRERAMGSVGWPRRSVSYCDTLPATTCVPVTLLDATTELPLELTDVDGPDVADGDDAPVLVVNAVQGGVERFFIGSPATSGDLTQWLTEPMVATGALDPVDDGALDSSGRVFLFQAPSPGKSGHLWYTTRRSTTDAFVAARELEGDINLDFDVSSSPTVFRRPDGSLDVAFVSNRGDGIYRVYLANCQEVSDG
jgi:hypothetical protein